MDTNPAVMKELEAAIQRWKEAENWFDRHVAMLKIRSAASRLRA